MQVPAQVEYQKAASAGHALNLLARYGTEARILAGGHSLIPMMKLRLAQPEVLIDISGITGLRYIERSNAILRIGALATHADLLRSELAGEHFAILHDAERVIADPIVREWGTVGGSLCQADPSEDLSAAFAALKGTMVISGLSPGGAVATREVSAREFHTGPYETVIRPAEMLTEIRLPLFIPGGATPLSTPRHRGETPLSPPSPGEPGTTRRAPGPPAYRAAATPLSTPRHKGETTSLFGSGYLKVCRRTGDWPVGAAGAAIWLDGDVIADAGIGLTALGARHFVAAEAEEFLRGQPATEEAFRHAGEIAARHCRPVTDQRGPEDYKRHLAGELTTRVLRLATGRARAFYTERTRGHS